MPHFEIAGATDTGKMRKKNEDCFSFYSDIAAFAVVADGIGGHVHGDVASRLCCDSLTAAFKSWSKREQSSDSKSEKLLCGSIRKVNEYIYDRNVREQHSLPMGCTVCAAVFSDDFVVAANAGDSRLYILENGRLRRLTKDHSVKHNGMNCLYLAVGITKTMAPEMFHFPSPEEGRYLLMSDGIYNSLAEDKIAEIFSAAATANEAVQNIIFQANANGGVDNLTVIAVIKRS